MTQVQVIDKDCLHEEPCSNTANIPLFLVFFARLIIFYTGLSLCCK